MASIFSKIINKEIPSYTILENRNFISFLDINPLTLGHCLVVPKKEIDYIFDLEDELLADLMIFSKKVAKAIREAIPCNRIGTAVVGLEVPHAHQHLIPIDSVDDINLNRPKLKPSQEELKATAEKIRSYI